MPMPIPLPKRSDLGISRRSFELRMTARGWKQIGAGSYASVYANPKHPDKVIKIGYANDHWPHYIQWANDHGYMGKQAPFVYSIKPMGDFYVAVMERLACTLSEVQRDRGQQEYFDVNTASKFTYDRWMPLKSELQAFKLDAIDFGWGSDWCGANTMFRGNGDIVLTDPMSSDISRNCKPPKFSLRASAKGAQTTNDKF